MAIGIILGNFVPNTGPALQKGQFVGVSIPIGMSFSQSKSSHADCVSRWIACNDVSHPLQDKIRDPASRLPET